MYLSDATPVQYVGSGPAYPDETDHDAMAENAVQHLTGHMFRSGGSIEDEPTDAAEKASQHIAQDTQGEDQAPGYTLDHAQVASDARQALRYGTGE